MSIREKSKLAGSILLVLVVLATGLATYRSLTVAGTSGMTGQQSSSSDIRADDVAPDYDPETK